MSDSGLSLIEMLVVLALLALVATISFPRISRPSASHEVRLVALRLAGELRWARVDAIRHRRSVALGLNVTDRWYQVAGGARVALPPTVDIAAVAARSFASGTSEASIVFFPDGSATGGRISLTSSGRTTFVVVDWLTGASRVEEQGP